MLWGLFIDSEFRFMREIYQKLFQLWQFSFVECGSHINTTAREFRIRSEGFPLVPSVPLCSYSISGPPMENYFKWIEISIESLTLDTECGQSSLKVLLIEMLWLILRVPFMCYSCICSQCSSRSNWANSAFLRQC